MHWQLVDHALAPLVPLKFDYVIVQWTVAFPSYYQRHSGDSVTTLSHIPTRLLTDVSSVNPRDRVSHTLHDLLSLPAGMP